MVKPETRELEKSKSHVVKHVSQVIVVKQLGGILASQLPKKESDSHKNMHHEGPDDEAVPMSRELFPKHSMLESY